MEIKITPFTREDLPRLFQVAFSDPHAEWKNWDGPYFLEALPSWGEVKANEDFWVDNPFVHGVWVENRLVGAVFAHYEDGELERWLDLGISIYDNHIWGKGLGTAVLRIWIGKVFEMVDLPHLGITTWSGNIRMMRIAEKAGMKEEARVRKVRFWQDRYWDSVKYGILRSEWEITR